MPTDPITTHRRLFLAACAVLAGELIATVLAGAPGMVTFVGGGVGMAAMELWRLRERRITDKEPRQ